MPTRIRCCVDWPNQRDPEIIDGLMFYVMPATGDTVEMPGGRLFTVRRLVHFVSDRPGVTTSSVVLDPK